MDLYQYFSPHFNPRLLKVSPRLQELDELKLAALELRKAVKRAALRMARAENQNVNTEEVNELKLALDYTVELLTALSNAHPGDKKETIEEIIRERENAPGWENWVRLASERLAYLENREPVERSA
jgi:hypothetical protein